MSDEETIAVPKKATEAMTKAATAFAMQSCITSSYSWPVYMSDLWAVMVANAPATPKPDPSPVCVEVKELEWEACSQSDPFITTANTPFVRYNIGRYCDNYQISLDGQGGLDWFGGGFDSYKRSLEAAQAACGADHEHRTLELVNARSVESVRAEYLKRLVSAFEDEKEIRGSDSEYLRCVIRDIQHVASSLTEGEG